MIQQIDQKKGISIDRAMKILEAIAEVKKGNKINISGNQKVTVRKASSISDKPTVVMPKELVSLVKDSFHVIQSYLKGVSKKSPSSHSQKDVVYNLKEMMLLISGAAQKIDRYHPNYQRFKNRSIKNSREYKQLKVAYNKALTKSGEERFLGKWIQPLEKVTPEKAKRMKERAFVDLESIKNDTQYELFFLKKGNGGHYFNIQILKNIKSILSAGSPFAYRKKEDILSDIHFWRDKSAQVAALCVLKSLGPNLNTFFKESRFYFVISLIRVTI